MLKRKHEKVTEIEDDFDEILKQAEQFDKSREKERLEKKRQQPKVAIPVKSPRQLEQEHREMALKTG
jgi:hypothetical protein